MSFISCLAWVQRGVAKTKPDRVRLNQEELKKLIDTQEGRLRALELHRDQDSEDEESDDGACSVEPKSTSGKRKKKSKSGAASSVPADEDDMDISQKYGLNEYDDDEDSENEDNRLSMAALTYYASNSDDPHISKETEEDEDNIEVVSEDNLIAVGKVSGMFCNLEIYIYTESDNNVFCYNDILLPSFPLSLECLGYDPTDKLTPANLVALGTMEPEIEIWDLDVIDAVEPAFVLAGAQKESGKKKKKMSVCGHTDAVLDLSWNRNKPNILASASADFTVGIWDLDHGNMVSNFALHKEKVQSVEWHPCEAESLVSGSFDHTVKVYDCRSEDKVHKTWQLPGEVEQVMWNHQDPYCLLAGTDTGHVVCLDVRTTEPVFCQEAHSEAITGLALSTSIPGCLVTCSGDKSVKVWDITQSTASLVTKKNVNMGEIHCAKSSPDSPLVFAIGGETEMRVLNLRKNAAVAKHFNIEVVDGDNDEVTVVGATEDDLEGVDQQPKQITKSKMKTKTKKMKKK